MEEHIENEFEEVLFVPTKSIAEATCKDFGCMPTRVLADNGFTYEIICGRCGKSL